MKVLLLNHEFPPVGTGAANASYYLSKELIPLGVEVKIITARFRDAKPLEIIKGVKVVRIPAGRRHHISPNLAELLSFLLSGVFFTLKDVRKDRPDIIHAFFTIPSGLIACLVKKIFKIPYIVSLRGSDIPGYDKRRFLGLLYFTGTLVRWIWRNSSGVFCTCEALRKLALKTDPNMDIKIIPNGIDLSEFYPALPGEKGIREPIEILLVGQLILRKRFHLIIEILPQLLKELGGRVNIKIAGHGPQREHLEQLAEKLGVRDKINFFGIIPHEKLADIYRGADIFVLSSESDGMANVILEALASGLPVVVTKSGAESLIKDGVNGFVGEGDVKTFLKRSILALAKDKNLLTAMGQRGFETTQGLGWGKVAASCLSNYKGILAKN